jgi:hypothetical protein
MVVNMKDVVAKEIVTKEVDSSSTFTIIKSGRRATASREAS